MLKIGSILFKDTIRANLIHAEDHTTNVYLYLPATVHAATKIPSIIDIATEKLETNLTSRYPILQAYSLKLTPTELHSTPISYPSVTKN